MIALAAIIFTWGTAFVSSRTKETGEKPEQELIIARSGGFRILSGSTNEQDAIFLKIENTGRLRIAGYVLQIFSTNGDALSRESGGSEDFLQT